MESMILKKNEAFIISCVNQYCANCGVLPYLLPDYEDRCQEARIAFLEAWRKCGHFNPDYMRSIIHGALGNYLVRTGQFGIPRNRYFKIYKDFETQPLPESDKDGESGTCDPTKQALERIHIDECADKLGETEGKMIRLFASGASIPDCLSSVSDQLGKRQARRRFYKAVERFKDLYDEAA